jgi:hypothetical protein
MMFKFLPGPADSKSPDSEPGPAPGARAPGPPSKPGQRRTKSRRPLVRVGGGPRARAGEAAPAGPAPSLNLARRTARPRPGPAGTVTSGPGNRPTVARSVRVHREGAGGPDHHDVPVLIPKMSTNLNLKRDLKPSVQLYCQSSHLASTL